jgi:metallo-beta-lactamase class B
MHMTRKAIALAVLTSIWLVGAQAQRATPPMSEMAREPFQVFDNLYFLGTGEVASYVITTSDGLILIDTLYGGEYTDYLLDNMRTMGLDIADVKYVLILQGHWDHYGGARVLQDEYTNAPFGAAEEDWQMIETDLGDAAPRRGFVIADGTSLTLGDTRLHAWSHARHDVRTLSRIRRWHTSQRVFPRRLGIANR